MNLSIDEDDDEPLPYPRYPIEGAWDEEPPSLRRRMVESFCLWSLAAIGLAMVGWVFYGVGLVIVALGRFLWRLL